MQNFAELPVPPPSEPGAISEVWCRVLLFAGEGPHVPEVLCVSVTFPRCCNVIIGSSTGVMRILRHFLLYTKSKYFARSDNGPQDLSVTLT